MWMLLIVTSNFSQIVNKATCLMTITHNNSNNSLTPQFKCVLFEKNWMNSVTHWSRLKKDLWSKFRLGPKIWISKQAQSGIRAKIRSWSTIHSVFKIRKTARFTAKIHNPCAFKGQIRRSDSCENDLYTTAENHIVTLAYRQDCYLLPQNLKLLWWHKKKNIGENETCTVQYLRFFL